MKTNRTFRKIASAATAAILAACAMMPMAVTNVSAYSITINNSNDNHTYEAYQIFTGSLSGTGANAKLSDVEWGSGVNHTAPSLMQDIKNALGSDFSSCTSAADVAEKLAESTDSTIANKFALAIDGYLTTPTATSNDNGNTYTIDVGNAAGYYLVKDKNDTLSDAYDAHTNYIVQVLDDKTDIEVKSALPAIEKKVQDINDSTESVVSSLQDSADYDIGNYVPFTLTGTLPSNYDTYPAYKYIITDKLSKGFELDASPKDLTVTVNGNTLTSGQYTVNVNSVEDSDSTLTITITDLKQHIAAYSAEAKVVVTYKAKLDTDAVIGSNGNPNTVYLQYSNDPYDTDNLGKTTDDLVKVFTYKAIVHKTDGTIPLQGAAFTLYKKPVDASAADESDWTIVKEISAGNTTDFEFIGLDDGQYKLVEDAAPEGYNKLSTPIYFNITAEHEALSDNPALTSLNVTSSEATFTADKNTGLIETEVKNKAGSILPSTGGIGTAPFYIGGGVLVAAAGVYIIVRKRFKNNDNNEK